MNTERKTKTLSFQQETIFVDCFNTIILRKEKKNRVFKNWDKALEAEYQIKWQRFYRSYKRINFWLCLKKIFKKFILQENFDLVLKKMYENLFKGRTEKVEDFITVAKNLYIEEEQKIHFVNNHFIDFLREQKKLGKKIYIVSDFYCSANEIQIWLRNLKINDIFAAVYSSSDFGKEKSTTGLYKVLLKKLDMTPKDVMMIGDNLWSDYLMAKSCGLSAKIINNKKELKNEN
ncbi:MAG: HAD family hydrolase [Clostridia bacterium]|nr:HAD family hydrolase [Clostridia bacterium]